MASRLKTCSVPGCYRITEHTRCEQHKTQDKRGKSRYLGYGNAWRKVRDPFIKANPRCAGVDGEHHPNCDGRATVADHYPETRRELVARGVPDPDAWHRLQPLSAPCHGWKGVQYDGLWGRKPKDGRTLPKEGEPRCCQWCGATFLVRKRSASWFCSLTCVSRNRHHNGRSQPIPWAQCQVCGGWYVQHRGLLICSDQCRAERKPKPQSYPPEVRAMYRRRRGMAERGSTIDRSCRRCGCTFQCVVGNGGLPTLCSGCKLELKRERKREEQRRLRQSGSEVYKARRRRYKQRKRERDRLARATG